MDLISIAVVAIVFIALCVFIYHAAKAWHWVNVLFLMLTFISGLAATIGLAQVGSLRYKQHKSYLDAQERADDLMAKAEMQVSGGNDSTNYAPDSLRGISQQLSLTMAGRGRVWSRGAVTPDGKNMIFKFTSPRPSGDASSVKLKNVVLFAFAEGIAPVPKSENDDENTRPPIVPVRYIGSVRVIEETSEMLKLAPEFISNPEEYAEPRSSWSLFEKMPLDRHNTVEAAFRRAQNLDDSAEINLSKLRLFLQNGVLHPERVGADPNSLEYEQLLDRYTFDGRSLGQIQNWIDAQPSRLSKEFEPTPEEVFVRYSFNRKSKKSYQVDSEGNIATDGFFTATGLAVEPSLHVGKEVQFGKDDVVSVDSITAAGYSRSDGTQVPPFSSTEPVTEIERFYVRRLRDYPYLLASTTEASAELEEETRRRQKSNAVQATTLQDTQKQNSERTRLTQALESDNKNLQSDQQTIAQVLQTKESVVDELKQKISKLRTQMNAAIK